MTAINSVVKESYIKMLSAIGAAATFFALMSVSSSTPWVVIYEPKMPSSLIKKD